jgi:thiamine-phosphate pyrophosphorylase
MKRPLDGRLCLVTDRAFAGGRPLEDVVLSAVRGGVTVVQLREKNASTREFVALGRALRSLLRPWGVPLLINDRVDVALAVGADGVHVGQSDMEVEDVRRLMGPTALVGLSVESVAKAKEATHLDVDYLGVGPIFPTGSKADLAPLLGLEGLSAVRACSALPLMAIGGIQAHNAQDVVAHGADGLAVISAICAAPDPESAARQLRSIVDTKTAG